MEARDNILDFLKMVLPTEGVYASAAPVTVRDYTTDVESILSAAERASNRGMCAYFSLASFKDTSERPTTANALSTRSLRLDIDIKEGKANHFQSMGEATAALSKMLADLPHPTHIVESGGGLHVYWPTEHNMPKPLFDVAATALLSRLAAIDPRLVSDRRATNNMVGILRVPGTNNYKQPDNPRPVVLKEVKTGSPLTKDDLRSLIESDPGATARTSSASQSAATDNVFFPAESQSKSVVDPERLPQCAVVAHYVENQATMDYNAWHQVGCLLTQAPDYDEAEAKFIEWSRLHPTFDEYECRRKFSEWWESRRTNNISGARCDSLAYAVCGDRSKCQNCPIFQRHGESGGSPFSLAKWERVQTEQQVTPLVQGYADIPTITRTDEVPSAIPPHLLGDNLYFAGSDGQFYRRGKKKKDSDEYEPPIPLASTPFWISSVVENPIEDADNDCAERIAYVTERKVDGKPVIAQFDRSILNDNMTAEMKAEFNRRSIVFNPLPSAQGYIREYMFLERSRLRQSRAGHRDKALDQMGWHEGGGFILGNTLYTGDHKSQRVHLYGTANELNHRLRFGTKGDIQEHLKCLRLYERDTAHPGARLAILFGLGASLMKFSTENGAVVSFHGSSGTGKTSTLHAAQSLWGDPTVPYYKRNDTYSARMNIAGALSNVPVFFDEMTNVPIEELRDFALTVTEGAERQRSSNDGSLSDIMGTWSTAFVATSNDSAAGRLETIAASVSPSYKAAANRILPIEVETTSLAESPEVLDDSRHTIESNYGGIGPLFLDYVLTHQTRVEQMVRESRVQYIGAMRDNEFRFRATALAVAEVAGTLLEEMGLIMAKSWVQKYLDSIGVQGQADIGFKTSKASTGIDLPTPEEEEEGVEVKVREGTTPDEAISAQRVLADLYMFCEARNHARTVSQAQLDGTAAGNSVGMFASTNDREPYLIKIESGTTTRYIYLLSGIVAYAKWHRLEPNDVVQAITKSIRFVAPPPGQRSSQGSRPYRLSDLIPGYGDSEVAEGFEFTS